MALKEHGLNRPPERTRWVMWTRQAELLSQSDKTASSFPEADLISKKAGSNSPDRDPMMHDRQFTVFFDIAKDESSQPLIRTTVYDDKKAGTEQEFLGSDTSQWVNWILEQANLPIALETIESRSKKQGAAPR